MLRFRCSYDYDSPISEAGDYGQPGIGGVNKFKVRNPCQVARTICKQAAVVAALGANLAMPSSLQGMTDFK